MGFTHRAYAIQIVVDADLRPLLAFCVSPNTFRFVVALFIARFYTNQHFAGGRREFRFPTVAIRRSLLQNGGRDREIPPTEKWINLSSP